VLITNIIDVKLISFILNQPYSIGDKLTLTGDQQQLYDFYLSKLKSNYPLDYIIGNIEFDNITLDINEGVFIPRPCTEKLISLALDIIKTQSFTTILDVCSGTGFIGLNIAKKFASTNIVCIENSSTALECLTKNVELNSLKNVKIINLDALDLDYSEYNNSLLLCNPPYVPELEFDDSVRYEPKEAIYSGKSGLTFFKKFIRMFTNKFPDQFIFELDPRNIFEAQQQFKNIFYTEVIKDEDGFDRFLVGKRIIL
jgi:release factor glutamine methyltransferase